MRVLHVTPFFPPSPARGGMARAAGELCRALAAAGHEVTVFAPGDRPGEEDAAGVRVRRFPGPRWAADRLVPFGRGVADAVGAAAAATDVAHLHGHRSGIVWQAAGALARAGVPWVLQPHGTFPHHGQQRLAKAAWDAVGRRPMAEARALLALSDAEARDLPRPAIVVGSGVTALGRAADGAAGWRPVGGLGGSEPPWLIGDVPPQLDKAADGKVADGAAGARLVFVGSAAPQKRLDALASVLQARPELSLDAAGPVPRSFMTVFGDAASRVTFHGALDDAALASVLAGGALLVHPAVGEAFGMAAFEAALAGLPGVVAGGHGCGEWYARAGGCVVPPDDPAALLNAIDVRLADRALARREAAAVAAYAARELSWPRVAARVAAVYQPIALAARGARATAGAG